MIKSAKVLGTFIAPLLLLSACSVSFSTANLGDIMLCSELTSDETCAENTTIFTPDTKTLNATVELNNAPEGTSVRAEWWFIDSKQKIDEVAYTTKGGESMLYFNLTSGEGYPEGNYELHVYLDEATEPNVTKFRVEADE